MSKSNITQRVDLTGYAHAIMQDINKVMDIINLIAPVVPTGGTTGQFNKFDKKESFVAYGKIIARRPIGGQASTIPMLDTNDSYTLKPYGLRAPIDNAQRDQAGSQVRLLEESRTRTVMINSAVCYLNDVINTIKDSVAAVANKGKWLDPNVDPVKEINEQIKAIYKATGIVPNTVAIDFAAWCLLHDHPMVVKRMPGADVAMVTPERVQSMLVNPNAKITIVDVAKLTGGGIGNASAELVGLMNTSVFICYNSPIATEYDPSFFKSFSKTKDLFTGIFTYDEAPHNTWYENDWMADPKLISASLCRRIDVTGAND